MGGAPAAAGRPALGPDAALLLQLPHRVHHPSPHPHSLSTLPPPAPPPLCTHHHRRPRRRYPVFLTLCHMLACSTMSYAVAASRMVPLQPVKSRRQFVKISLLALIFCFTVVLGNISLRFIPVSFNQAIGATTPAFTALLAVAMNAPRETRPVYLSLIPVVVGIVIASGAEPMFNLIGFMAAVTATGARAFKSVLQVGGGAGGRWVGQGTGRAIGGWGAILRV